MLDPPPLDDDVIARLAACASIPPTADIASLKTSLQLIVDKLWGMGRWHSVAKGTTKASKRIALAAQELHEALVTTDPDTLNFIRLSFGSGGPRSLADYVKLTKRLADAAQLVATTSPANPWNVFRELFQKWLREDIQELGGYLSTKRSLADAYEILAPYLPVELVAARSDSTLKRVARRVRGGVKKPKNSSKILKF